MSALDAMLAADYSAREVSVVTIAQRWGIEPRHVLAAVDALGVPRRRAVLDELLREAVVADYVRGDRVRDIQARYGIGTSTVQRIAREAGAPMRPRHRPASEVVALHGTPAGYYRHERAARAAGLPVAEVACGPCRDARNAAQADAARKRRERRAQARRQSRAGSPLASVSVAPGPLPGAISARVAEGVAS